MAASSRYQEIAETLGRHGMDFLATAVGVNSWLRPSPSSPDSPIQARTVPERLRLVLEELGPTFVKLGQLLSTRPDLLPPEYITELSKLQDSAPPVTQDAIIETVRAELGADPQQIFAEFDESPLASASIGQAHTAVLADGTEVVVKVRRPDAVRKVNEDLEILQNLADRASRIWEPARTYNVRGLVQEFAHTLRGELDYLREARNAERFAANFAGHPDVSIPRVFRETTTSRVLTLERVSGIRINDVAALDAAGVDRPALARTGARLMLRMIFEHGFFHADPHPGNLFVQPDGSITLIDFGMVGDLEPELQDKFVDFLIAFTRRQPEELADALIDLSVTKGIGDRDHLREGLSSFVADYSDKPLSEVSFAHLASELLGIVRQQRLQLPREVALIFKVLIMMEGIGVQLDPNYDLMGVLTPYVRRILKERLSLAAMSQRLLRASADTGALMIEMPSRLRRILDRADRSGIEVHLRAAELEPLVARTERIGNRLVAGLITAALINGVGDLIVSEKRWRSWEGALLSAGVTVVSSLTGYLLWTSRHRHR
ncbi:ABC1 kinase family protein [Mycetocola miduiensis]|uniref:Ubiquinone biosynthesis protein n=1 Tax=Mycetocola miduiensis TaxID=995034 RepID=A0A1I5CVU4_9MICO|nr:AarF/ABC1/UbiB kinase family protein [Mycetocola miduiensis]SFN91105.1 ubiquinone biosynthesis protein [Mycetocola miduiensis]